MNRIFDWADFFTVGLKIVRKKWTPIFKKWSEKNFKKKFWIYTQKDKKPWYGPNSYVNLKIISSPYWPWLYIYIIHTTISSRNISPLHSYFSHMHKKYIIHHQHFYQNSIQKHANDPVDFVCYLSSPIFVKVHNFSGVHSTVQVICSANHIGNCRTPKLLRFQRFPIPPIYIRDSEMNPD